MEDPNFTPDDYSTGGKKRKWCGDEDLRIIDLRGKAMKWNDISKQLPGRSPTACRLHYQNYLEKCDWNEEQKTKLANLYERCKMEMWGRIAQEMRVPWRAAEQMHWQIGQEEMAQRAGVTSKDKLRVSHIDTAQGPVYPQGHSVVASSYRPSATQGQGIAVYGDPCSFSAITQAQEQQHRLPGLAELRLPNVSHGQRTAATSSPYLQGSSYIGDNSKDDNNANASLQRGYHRTPAGQTNDVYRRGKQFLDQLDQLLREHEEHDNAIPTTANKVHASIRSLDNAGGPWALKPFGPWALRH